MSITWFVILEKMEKTIKKLTRVLDFSKSSQVTVLLASQILVGIFITITTLWVFFALGEDVVEKEVVSFDALVIHTVYAFRSSITTEVMKAITFFGGEIFLGLAIVLTIL